MPCADRHKAPKSRIHDILVLLASGRLDDVELAFRRYVEAEVALLQHELRGTDYAALRLVWSRGRLYTKCKNEHVSFETLANLTSDQFVSEVSNRLAVMASIKSLISNLEKI